MPAPAPTNSAPKSAMDRWNATDRKPTAPLASTMLMPNQRRRDSSLTTIGPRPMPIARPMKRVAKSR